MTSKRISIVLFGGIAVLLSACATDPAPPSLPAGQFIVIVKGEQAPLATFHQIVQGEFERKRLPGCTRKVPSDEGKSTVEGQLVYECTGQTRGQAGDVLEVFGKAYGNSTASLLEMKVTTSGACVYNTCGSGTLRAWKVPCLYAC